MKLLTGSWGNLAPAIRYILVLFFASRVLLTLLGVYSYRAFSPVYGRVHEQRFSKYLPLDIWGVWDSEWYVNIAKNGYSPRGNPIFSNQANENSANFGFFPLYPLLMRLTGSLLNDNFVAGIIISNVFLLVACFFLYKLVEKEDKRLAYRAVKYLFLFPTAFILSGVFAESLFLALLLISFYYAQNKRWPIVGIAGFFLSLAKPTGIVIVIPLLYEYLRQKNFLFNKIKTDILYLFLFPLGLLTFMFYGYAASGDFLAYYHTQHLGWGVGLTNPLVMLIGFLFNKKVEFILIGAIILSETLLLVYSYKKIDFSQLLLAILLLIIPLSTGVGTTLSIPRLSLTIFPFFILLAKMSEGAYLDYFLSIFLGLSQGFLFIYWVNGVLIV